MTVDCPLISRAYAVAVCIDADARVYRFNIAFASIQPPINCDVWNRSKTNNEAKPRKLPSENPLHTRHRDISVRFTKSSLKMKYPFTAQFTPGNSVIVRLSHPHKVPFRFTTQKKNIFPSRSPRISLQISHFYLLRDTNRTHKVVIYVTLSTLSQARVGPSDPATFKLAYDVCFHSNSLPEMVCSQFV